MSKLSIEDFIKDVLKLEFFGVSSNGWTRGICCPIHGETRSSFGIQVVYPYMYKCFSCGAKGSLAYLTSQVLGLGKAESSEIIQRKLDIQFDLSKVMEHKPQEAPVVPTVIAEMYEQALSGSMAQKYLAWRKIPLWTAKLFGLGYDDLTKSLTTPMINVNSGKIQGYSLVMFDGAFDDVIKKKECQDAGKTVTVPMDYKKYKTCMVVEGITDAMRSLELGIQKGLPKFCPVVLNTAFPTKDQVNFIRGYNKIILGLDHDDAGRRGREYLVDVLSDKAMLFDLEFAEERKDVGELTVADELALKLILQKKKGSWKK